MLITKNLIKIIVIKIIKIDKNNKFEFILKKFVSLICTFFELNLSIFFEVKIILRRSLKYSIHACNLLFYRVHPNYNQV